MIADCKKHLQSIKTSPKTLKLIKVAFLDARLDIYIYEKNNVIPNRINRGSASMFTKNKARLSRYAGDFK